MPHRRPVRRRPRFTDKSFKFSTNDNHRRPTSSHRIYHGQLWIQLSDAIDSTGRNLNEPADCQGQEEDCWPSVRLSTRNGQRVPQRSEKRRRGLRIATRPVRRVEIDSDGQRTAKLVHRSSRRESAGKLIDCGAFWTKTRPNADLRIGSDQNVCVRVRSIWCVHLNPQRMATKTAVSTVGRPEERVFFPTVRSAQQCNTASERQSGCPPCIQRQAVSTRSRKRLTASL